MAEKRYDITWRWEGPRGNSSTTTKRFTGNSEQEAKKKCTAAQKEPIVITKCEEV
ncbi:hypothetical protein ACYULU_06495 [Breznakiellaceae bacterium SP9]